MKHYLYHEGGNISSIGHCQDDADPPEALNGAALLVCGPPLDGVMGHTHRVVDGELVAYTAEQSASKSEQPMLARWCNDEMRWVELRTLAKLRRDSWSRIKAERARRLAGTFLAGGQTYNCNREAIAIAANGAMLAKAALDLTWSKTWTLADNTRITLTADQVFVVARACDNYIGALWSTGHTLRTQIAAATTAEAVEAITWP